MEGTREEGRVGLGGGKGRRKGGRGSAGFGGKEHGEETRVGEALAVGELEDGEVDCLGEPQECLAVDREQLAADKTGDGDRLRPVGVCPPFVARRELLHTVTAPDWHPPRPALRLGPRVFAILCLLK